MKLDLTVLQIGLIFFPGIIWASIHRRFVARERTGTFDFLVLCFVFGIISYLVTFAAYSAVDRVHPLQRFFEDPGNSGVPLISTIDLLISTGVAFVLALLWTYTSNYKLDVRLFNALKASKSYGDEDLWDYTFNSPRPYVEYVHVRDFERDLVYCGWVDAFSGSGKLRELLLRDVIVYGLDGEKLYDVPSLYISKEPGHWQIDFPYKEDR